MSLKMKFAGAAVIALAMFTAACSDNNSTGLTGDTHSASIVRGNNQRGPVGEKVSDYLVVQALDENGHPIAGAHVTWTVTSGGGTLTDVVSVTDSYGFALAAWTLGMQAGTQTVTATIDNVPTAIVFTAVADERAS